MAVTRRNRRLVFIWKEADRSVVATEDGGVSYNNPILAFDLAVNSQRALLVEQRIVFPETVCATATELLATSAVNQ